MGVLVIGSETSNTHNGKLRNKPSARTWWEFHTLGHLLFRQNPRVFIGHFIVPPSTTFDLPSACSSLMVAALTGSLTRPLLFLCPTHLFRSRCLWPGHYPTARSSRAVVYRRTGSLPSLGGRRQICSADRCHQECFPAAGLSWFRGLPGLRGRNTRVHVPRREDRDLAPLRVRLTQGK